MLQLFLLMLQIIPLISQRVPLILKRVPLISQLVDPVILLLILVPQRFDLLVLGVEFCVLLPVVEA
jgi:hypothetical protein